MKHIPLSNGGFAVVDDADFDSLSGYAWYRNTLGYVERHILQSERLGKKGTVYMHRQIMRPPNGKVVDHINHDKLDNQRHNLRVCAVHENLRNQGPPKTPRKTSSYKGVSWHERNGKWRARVNVRGRDVCIGYYNSELEAAQAYNDSICKYHGEYAWLNPLPDGLAKLIGK